MCPDNTMDSNGIDNPLRKARTTRSAITRVNPLKSAEMFPGEVSNSPLSVPARTIALSSLTAGASHKCFVFCSPEFFAENSVISTAKIEEFKQKHYI